MLLRLLFNRSFSIVIQSDYSANLHQRHLRPFNSVKCDYITRCICVFLFSPERNTLTAEFKTHVRRAGNGECFRSTVTWGELFLIPNKSTMYFFFLFPSYSLFRVQSRPQGPLSPSFAWQVLVNQVQNCRQWLAASFLMSARFVFSLWKGFVETHKCCLVSFLDGFSLCL